MVTKYQSERDEFEQKFIKLSSEMEALQTAATIAEVDKEDEVAKVQRQHNEDFASFQHILEGRYGIFRV